MPQVLNVREFCDWKDSDEPKWYTDSIKLLLTYSLRHTKLKKGSYEP